MVGSLIVCAAIAQFEGDFIGKAVTELRSSVWIFALNATIAGLTLAPALVTPWLSLFAIAPIAILWIFVQQQAQIGQTLRDVEAIQGFAGRLAGEVDLGGIGRAALDETTRLLRARQAGLVIFDDEVAFDDPLSWHTARRTTGPHGRPTMASGLARVRRTTSRQRPGR